MDDTFFKKAFDSCISGIDAADIVVAVVDGPDADSGTCFEIGYAYANKKPIFAVRTDLRALEEMGVNLMISQSVRHFIHDIDKTTAELAEEIVRGIGEVGGSNVYL